jgi:hypothetical protein
MKVAGLLKLLKRNCSKINFAAIIALSLALSLLTACGGGGGGGNNAGTSVSAANTTSGSTSGSGGSTTSTSGTSGSSTTTTGPDNYGPVWDLNKTVTTATFAESGNLSVPATYSYNLLDPAVLCADPDGDAVWFSVSHKDSNTTSTVSCEFRTPDGSATDDDTKKTLLYCTSTGIGADRQSVSCLSRGSSGELKSATMDFDFNVTAQTTTLGAYIINELGNQAANIGGVSNGSHYFYFALAGISTSLLTDAQILDLLTIAFDPVGNNGCTQTSVTNKSNWVVDRSNNRIRVNYTVYNDAQSDLFIITKTGSATGTYNFMINGINF